jgi:hypothetical protein
MASLRRFAEFSVKYLEKCTFFSPRPCYRHKPTPALIEVIIY